MGRRDYLQDRRGIRPAVGGTGRVGDMGRLRRHAYVQAPESRLSGAKKSQGPR